MPYLRTRLLYMIRSVGLRLILMPAALDARVRDVKTEPKPSAVTGFLALTESLNGGSGPGGRSWTREQLYER